MKSLRSFFLSMLVALGLAAGLARDTCAQSLFTPYCPAATITSTRAAAASIFNLSKIRSYTALSASYNVLSGSNFNLVAMVAHRGVWEFCPENTLEAYEAALDLGAEAVEMDIRPSAPGYNSNEGVNYPNGEMFLTHDYDLRGESPDLDNINPQNVIYTATPDSLTGRAMVDRNGRPAYANNCVPVPVPVTSNCTATTPIVFRSLTALLTHILLKARANPATIVTGGGNQGRDLVTRGAEVMLDVKGGDRGLVFDPATPDLVCPTNRSDGRSVGL